ncbi:MAG: cell division protein FtsW [Deltaproteobacteria bacterium]|nr:cell division protein FtsW [Deltaproteobacteria bacterium]
MKDGIAVDGWLFFSVAALLAVGIIMVLSTSYLYSQERFSDGTYFFRKQLTAVGAGLLTLCIAALLPAASYRRFVYPLLALTLFILILVLIPGIGLSRGGARRWLPLGGFVFQPAELAKITLVLYLAHSLAKKGERVQTFGIGLLPHLIIGGLFLGLVLLEPDLGTTLILGMILFLMLFVGGAKFSHLAAIGLLALPAVGLAVVGADYRLRRLLTFLDPWRDASNTGFQIIQSLALFGVILVRGFRLAARIEEPFCQYLAFGTTTLLGLQALIHMGVVMGLMPTKGLVLPFISYGGSAMVMNMTCAGILLSLSRGRM